MDCAKYLGGCKRYLLLVIVSALILTFSFTPAQANASTGFFTNIWCDITSLFGFTCNTPSEITVTNPALQPVATTPLSEKVEANYPTVTSITEVLNISTSTTLIEEHDTEYPVMVTYQTTIENADNNREISDADFLNLFYKLTVLVNQTNRQNSTISRDLFDKQIERVFDKNSESVDDVQEDISTLSTNIANSFTTDLLAVTGNVTIDENTTVGGDLIVDGSITAGILNVSALSSGGALTAPYFTATSTTATSTFMGAVGIGTTSPQSLLHVYSGSTNAIIRTDAAAGTQSGLHAFVNGNMKAGFFYRDATSAMEFINYASGPVRFVTNSTDRIFIDGSGNIGFGGSMNGSGISGSHMTILQSSGNVGIGTSTPNQKLTVIGNTYLGGSLQLTGAFKDSVNATGTLGMVLQTTGTSTQWVATSTLGLGNNTFLGLTDTQSSFTANRLIFTNSGGTALTDSSNLVFDGTNFGIGSTNPASRLHVSGGNLQIGETATTTGNPFLYLYGYDSVAGATRYGRMYVASDGSFGIQAEDTYLTLSGASYVQSNSAFVVANNNILLNNTYGLNMQTTQGSYKKVFDMDSTNTVRLGAIGSSWTTGGETAFYTNGSEKVRIDSSGNVGIGTTTPASLLSINGDTNSKSNLIVTNTNSASTAEVSLSLQNNIGQSAKIFKRSSTATDSNAFVIEAGVNGVSTIFQRGAVESMRISGSGQIGIGTTTPSAKFTVIQSAQSSSGGFWLSTSDNTDFRSQYMNTSGVLSFYGGDTAGTLNTATLNAAGEWTNASDISYKENIADLSYGLEAVLALQPRSYDIKDTNNHRVGFIAQEVEEVIPEVVSGEEGSKGISYGNIVAVAISAIQELAEKVSGFAESFTSKFISAETLNSNKVETDTLCIGQTCITEAELIKFLEESKQSPAPVIEQPKNTATAPENIEEIKENEPEQINEPEQVIEIEISNEEVAPDTETHLPVESIEESSSEAAE